MLCVLLYVLFFFQIHHFVRCLLVAFLQQYLGQFIAANPARSPQNFPNHSCFGMILVFFLDIMTLDVGQVAQNADLCVYI